VVVSKEQLLDFLSTKFFGQKICVVGATAMHQSFLDELNKKVAFVPLDVVDKPSCVGILCFGETNIIDKKAIKIATDIEQVVHKDFLVCYDFIELGNKQIGVIASFLSEAAIFGQKLFCKQVLEGREVLDDARCFFAALLDCLQSAKNQEVKAICLMLSKLKGILNKELSFDFCSISARLLYAEFCCHFLSKRPFEFVYGKDGACAKYGLPYTGINIDTADAIFRLNEFCSELSIVANLAKRCVEEGFLLYKKTNIGEMFFAVSNMDNREIIRRTFLVEQKNDLGLLNIARSLGLV
jgi:hypothetical protein